MGERNGFGTARVIGFVVVIAAAVVGVLVVLDDGSLSVGRIAVEAAIIGATAYVVSHLLWPRWRRRAPASRRSHHTVAGAERRAER